MPDLPLAARALLLGFATLAGAELGHALSFADLPLATLWPPLGILIAVLTLSAPRNWPAYLLAHVVGACVSHLLLHERTWAKSLLLCAAELTAALVAAGLLTWRRKERFGFQSLSQVIDFLLRALVGTTLGALLAGTALASLDPGQDPLEFALAWWLSRALGVITFATLVIAWETDRQPAPPSSQMLRALSAMTLAFGIIWGLLALKGTTRIVLAYPLLFVPLPAYAAITCSRKTALAVVLIVGGIGIFRTSHGASVVSQICETSLERSTCIQIVVAMISLSGLAVATIVEERRAAQRENRETLRLLWQTNQELESRVAERTQRLELASIELMEKRNLLAHAARVSTAGELAAGIAHELNQPLYAITNYASGLQRCLEQQAPEVNVRTVLADLRLESQRAADILKRLRQFVKQTCYKPTSLSPRDVIDEAVQLNRHELRQKGIQLVLDLPPELPPVRGDAIQLQQVLVNLLRNAIESLLLVPTDERRLTIRARERDGMLHIAVQDTGAGFPVEHEPRLFDPFFTTKPEGMGIGLTISRSIVEAHGGRLCASRLTPRGATFDFCLPLAPRPEEATKRPPTTPIPQPHVSFFPASPDHEPAHLPG